ncbi:hypothetical protein QQF64_030766 [Cirrhinus molitorella]|uniref:C-type lectin domain-containing protein n=1 Tax=Cirrhinus molitorella TaxID=172907 RepID=A0ABR3N4P3_9TELE
MDVKASVTVLLFLSLFGLNVSVYRHHFPVNEDLSWEEAQQHCRQYYDDLSTVYELIVVHQRSTWDEALEYCRQNYIDLAIINSEDIMEEAKINSAAADTDEVWTGLRFLAGGWFWVNGRAFDYNVWSSDGEPQCPAVNQRCGVYDRTQNVCKPTDCERRLNFLCVKEKYQH